MTTLFIIIFFCSCIALLLGLINPRIVIRWGSGENKKRKNVLKYYGIATIVSFILIGVIGPKRGSDNNTVASNNGQTKAEKAKEEKKQSNSSNTDNISKKSSDDKAKENVDPKNSEDEDANNLRVLKVSDFKWGYYDKRTNKTVIEPQYTKADEFSEGLALVQVPVKTESGTYYKWGYIDKKGEFKIPPKFDNNDIKDIRSFHEGLALIKYEGSNCEYIDKSGNTFLKTDFEIASDFSEGLAAVKSSPNGYAGYINKKGEIVIDLQYIMTGNFSEGLAPVQRKEDQWVGFIDKEGKMIIEPKFSKAKADYNTGKIFNNGIAVVELKDGKAVYIDKKGNIIKK